MPPLLAELPAPPEAVTVWPWTRASKPVPGTAPDGSAWPAISIVMPCLNQAAFLEHAIRSVLLQGYPNLEVIVMDGGSTDGTRAILERYDSWLTYWECAPDRGPADALNRGFARARGEILGFLNADDFYLPNCLDTMASAFLARPDIDVVSAHGYFAKADGTLGAAAFSDQWNLRRFTYGACVLLQPATFFRRQAFTRAGGFRDSGSVCWDMELWADLATVGARFDSHKAFVAAFRLHRESITGGDAYAARRRRDARAVMAAMRGREETVVDRAWHLVHRVLKFSHHPLRTISQRWFVHSALDRWSL